MAILLRIGLVLLFITIFLDDSFVNTKTNWSHVKLKKMAKGCYINPKTGLFKVKPVTFGDNSVEKCIKYCSKHKYALLEGPKLCRCGDKTVAPLKKTRMSRCPMKCAGNKKERCGGKGFARLYKNVK